MRDKAKRAAVAGAHVLGAGAIWAFEHRDGIIDALEITGATAAAVAAAASSAPVMAAAGTIATTAGVAVITAKGIGKIIDRFNDDDDGLTGLAAVA
jgi:hypothetical protein